jgi:hypothetical protein
MATALVALGCSDGSNGDSGPGPGVPSSGGVPGAGGATGGAPTVTGGMGGSLAVTGGSPSTGGAPSTGGGTGSELGTGVMEGSGSTTERYQAEFVTRNDIPYVFITNGWGNGWQSHRISWEGTSFIIEESQGNGAMGGVPSSFPTMFCGLYSVPEVADCGLPVSIDSLQSLQTGWRWAPNGNTGQFNAAYDIWIGNGSSLHQYLMVWLRDPPDRQPAGAPNPAHQDVSVEGLPGKWDIWDGTVNGLPIINWVQREGQDLHEIEFDVLSLIRDAEQRQLTIHGTHINAVAVGFEIWDGPITNLESVDFYVDVN